MPETRGTPYKQWVPKKQPDQTPKRRRAPGPAARAGRAGPGDAARAGGRHAGGHDAHRAAPAPRGGAVALAAPRVPPVRGRRACRGVRGSWAEPNRGARRRAFATCTTLPCLSPVARLQPALLTVAGPAGAGTGADVGTLRVRNASVGCSLMTGVGVLGAAALPGSLPGARDRRLLTVSQPLANCDRPGVIERARARQLMSRRVVVTEERACRVCHMHIGTKMSAVFPNGVLVCYRCLRKGDPHVCPLTGVDFREALGPGASQALTGPPGPAEPGGGEPPG